MLTTLTVEDLREISRDVPASSLRINGDWHVLTRVASKADTAAVVPTPDERRARLDAMQAELADGQAVAPAAGKTAASAAAVQAGAAEGTTALPRALAADSEPTPPMLIGKDDILEALNLSSEKWRWLLRLNRDYKGPMKTRAKAKTVAEKAALKTWFKERMERHEELDERHAQRDAAGANVYPFGRNGLVAPDIAGGGRSKPRL
ncbi:MAG: hypothetical protein NTW87_06335 [Planctomycetota bacterium]|nr:hypothetical protein [Planctomycetota bacterium]